MIHVLSVKQPHADAILHFGKFCENRSHRKNFTGTLYIHSSASRDRKCDREQLPESPGGYLDGHILGRVTMLGCLHIDELEEIRDGYVDAPRWMMERFWDMPDNVWEFVCGEWCSILADPEVLVKPIPAKGKLGIWTHDVKESRLRFKPKDDGEYDSMGHPVWDDPDPVEVVLELPLRKKAANKLAVSQLEIPF